MNDDNHINFDAPAILRKWPSLNGKRISSAEGARPYLIVEGTLDHCIRQYMAKPITQQHLYEIHTTPQGELVSAVLTGKHLLEIALYEIFCRYFPLLAVKEIDSISSAVLTTILRTIPEMLWQEPSGGLVMLQRTFLETKCF